MVTAGRPHTVRRWQIGLMWCLVAAVLFAAALITSLQLAPSLIGQGRDSGVYGYGGMVLHDGGTMYVDVWDNKLPGIHFINALAFALFGVDRWAIWWIEVIFVWLAAVTLYWLLREAYGLPWLSWTLALAFLLLAHYETLIFDTDFTEVFALLPQVLAFALGFQLVRQPRARWAFLIGLCGAAAFIIKQSTVGFAPAYVLAILLAGPPLGDRAQRLRTLGVTILGGLAGLGVLLVYLAAHGVVATGIEAGFVAPSQFHRWVGSVPLWRTLAETVATSKIQEVFAPLSPLVIAGAVAAGRGAVHRSYATPTGAARATLAVWAVVTGLFDLVLVNPTGRGASYGYEHYYVTLIPALVLMAAAGLAALACVPRLPRWTRGVLVLASVVWIAISTGSYPAEVWLDRVRGADWDIIQPERGRPMAHYVEVNTQPDDRVLVWGASPNINFQAHRFSPTKYFYAYGVIVPDEASQERLADMVRDLDETPPAMIVDMTMYDGTRVPPLDPAMRETWWERGGRRDTGDLSPLYDWVAAHCAITDRVDSVAIYRCPS